jgi:hypothetical protein
MNVAVAHSTQSERLQSQRPVQEPAETGWRRYVKGVIAAEVSTGARYADEVVQFAPVEGDSGAILALIDAPSKRFAENVEDIGSPTGSSDDGFPVVLLNANMNHDHDLEGTLSRIHRLLPRGGRVVAVLYNSYLAWLYRLASWLGVRQGPQPCTFLTETDLRSIATLSDFEIVRMRPVGFSPWRLFGLGDLLNRVLPVIPFVRQFSLAHVVVLRPVKVSKRRPSLSIVIPARNERGNIENALKRMPELGITPEIIFVEGHSTDGTWEEIQRVAAVWSDRFPLKIMRQTGKGKADAVRLGFEHATGELLTILDADLTMPPELLGRFYEAWCRGLADFVNGNRLVYPMEGEAMKLLNWFGNIFFAKALSYVCGTRLGDSLCGTKLFSRADYLRFRRWNKDFGDFDPFGDFELLFPAATLGLGVVDVPIRYRDREYGSTNIRRFYHGMMLFKMTWVGFLRMKLGKTPANDAV